MVCSGAVTLPHIHQYLRNHKVNCFNRDLGFILVGYSETLAHGRETVNCYFIIAHDLSLYP